MSIKRVFCFLFVIARRVRVGPTRSVGGRMDTIQVPVRAMQHHRWRMFTCVMITFLVLGVLALAGITAKQASDLDRLRHRVHNAEINLEQAVYRTAHDVQRLRRAIAALEHHSEVVSDLSARGKIEKFANEISSASTESSGDHSAF